MAPNANTELNLNPYGNSWSGGTGQLVEGSYEVAALQRAAAKYETVRRNFPPEPIVSPFTSGFIVAVAICAPLSTIFFWLTAMMASSASIEKIGPLFAAVFGVLIACLPLVLYFSGRLSSPKHAIQQFYRCVAGANHKRARAVGLQCDLDDFPRYQPSIVGLGKPSGVPQAFRADTGFRRYWNELLRSHSVPYCIAHMSAFKVTYLTPDVAVVNFRLRLTMNTSLWRLFVLVLVVIAVIADLVTRKVVTIEMQKVVVRVGEQWHVFSSDWQGYEDVDHSWLSMSHQ